MAQAGYLERTTSVDGIDLVVFNWAPTQWDEPMDHYTVTVNYPLEFRESATREEVEQFLLENDFSTEPWMNESYLIDYRVSLVGEVYRVQVLLHKNNPEKKFNFRIQQYISKYVFPEITSEPSNYKSDISVTPFETDYSDREWVEYNTPRQTSGRIGLILVLGILLLGTLIAVGNKHDSMVKAQATFEDVQWAG